MQAVTQEHILQNWAALKEQQLQEVNQYNQRTLVDPTLKYLNETQQEHLKGLQPNITAVRLNLHLVTCSEGHRFSAELQLAVHVPGGYTKSYVGARRMHVRLHR